MLHGSFPFKHRLDISSPELNGTGNNIKPHLFDFRIIEKKK